MISTGKPKSKRLCAGASSESWWRQVLAAVRVAIAEISPLGRIVPARPVHAIVMRNRSIRLR